MTPGALFRIKEGETPGGEGDELMEREDSIDEGNWEALAEWPSLHGVLEDVVARHAGRHPGVITEAIVDAITARFEITPRQVHYRERRKNHPERIRRLSHEVFRILDTESGEAPVRRIAAGVLKAFILVPRDGDPSHGTGEAP